MKLIIKENKCKAGLGSVHRLLIGCWAVGVALINERELTADGKRGFKQMPRLEKSCINHKREV